MHGPEEVAWAVRAVRPRRGGARPAAATPSRSASWTRSAAPPSTSRPASRRPPSRVVFINTGFLDRTGDEIHTSMEAGADAAQGRHAAARPGSRPMRTGTSISACSAGCAARRRSARACGPRRTSWRRCWTQKVGHPKAGANTAWVPSPTAATLHALHYHQVDVAARQAEIAAGGRRAELDDLLTVPLADADQLARPDRAGGARQQRAGHPRLCGALGRPGRRLLQGAGHQRCRPDGGPRDAAHLRAAHRQLAAPRRRDARTR